MNFGSSAPDTPAQRAIDYRNDDLSSMVFALDLPANLQPVPSRSILTFDATTAGNPRQACRGGADPRRWRCRRRQAAPPPATGRTYYLLGPGAKDKAALTRRPGLAQGATGGCGAGHAGGCRAAVLQQRPGGSDDGDDQHPARAAERHGAGATGSNRAAVEPARRHFWQAASVRQKIAARAGRSGVGTLALGAGALKPIVIVRGAGGLPPMMWQPDAAA